jgi:hypothetical protein
VKQEGTKIEEVAKQMVGVEEYDDDVENFIGILTKTPYDCINVGFSGEEGRMDEYAKRMLLAMLFHYYKYIQDGNPPIDYITEILNGEDIWEMLCCEEDREGEYVPKCYGDYMNEFRQKYDKCFFDEKKGLVPDLSLQ